MARHISKEIVIDSPPEVVWEILTDLDAYGSWNPFLIDAGGKTEPGERLSITGKATEKGFTFHPRVTESVPGQRLAWVGKLGGVPGLFTGEHRHELEVTSEGTRYTQSENFSGILVPFTGKIIAETEAAFERMNQALKERAEGEGPGKKPPPSSAPG
jgi:hypothetical protein